MGVACNFRVASSVCAAASSGAILSTTSSAQIVADEMTLGPAAAAIAPAPAGRGETVTRVEQSDDGRTDGRAVVHTCASSRRQKIIKIRATFASHRNRHNVTHAEQGRAVFVRNKSDGMKRRTTRKQKLRGKKTTGKKNKTKRECDYSAPAASWRASRATFRSV